MNKNYNPNYNQIQAEPGQWHSQLSLDAQRRWARLAFILENLFKDTCYEHGEECKTKADCWAKEIITRQLSWD